MKLSIGKYRNNIPYITTLLNKKKDLDLNRSISEIAVATNVPIIAVITFSQEILGESSVLARMYERLYKFYGYTEVTE